MFDPGQVIVGLEIGTHKICVAVGEAGAKGELTILGIGQMGLVCAGILTDADRTPTPAQTRHQPNPPPTKTHPPITPAQPKHHNAP